MTCLMSEIAAQLHKARNSPPAGAAFVGLSLSLVALLPFDEMGIVLEHKASRSHHSHFIPIAKRREWRGRRPCAPEPNPIQ
jgi:hypothetical protein